MKITNTVPGHCSTHGAARHRLIVWVTETDETGAPSMWDTETVCIACDQGKPANCPRCHEPHPSWADTEHGVCDDCMQNLVEAGYHGDTLSMITYEGSYEWYANNKWLTMEGK